MCNESQLKKSYYKGTVHVSQFRITAYALGHAESIAFSEVLPLENSTSCIDGPVLI